MLANEYTEKCLQKLSKPQLIVMVSSERDKTKFSIESLRDEVKKKTSSNLRLMLV